jgi:hypothetical protein
MMTWQANVARRSAGLGTILSSEEHSVAAAYHAETVACLQAATRSAEVIDILEEFAKEVLSDLELKDIAFRSRELLVSCLQIVQDLVSAPAVLKEERGRQTEICPIYGNRERLAAAARKEQHFSGLASNKSSRNRNRASGPGLRTHKSNSASLAFPGDDFMFDEDMDNGDGMGFGYSPEKEVLSVEQEQKLCIVAVERVRVINCVLKVPVPPPTFLAVTLWALLCFFFFPTHFALLCLVLLMTLCSFELSIAVM